jgi:hypothetical protein
MSNVLRDLACVAVLAVGLGGCTGTAGVATWQYQSGPSGETERVHESQIHGDTSRGIGGETCTSTVRRQAGSFGEGSVNEVSDCRSSSPIPRDRSRNEPRP